jgi:hypothetical protein
VQYEHAYPAAPASGTSGYLGGISRGALGSTAASHLAGTTVTPRCLKTLSPRALTTLSYGAGEIVAPGDYRPKVSDGGFEFAVDPAGFPGLSGYYAAYDEDSPDGVTLASLAQSVLGFAREQGGAGLSPEQLDSSALDFIPLSRCQVDHAQGTLETLLAVIDEVALDRRGFAARPLALYYDSALDRAVLTSLRQGAPVIRLPSAREVIDQTALDSRPSAVAVQFANDDPSQLISRERMWHKAVGEQFNALPSPNDTFVSAIRFCGQDRALGAGWQTDATPTHASPYLRYLTDGQAGSGWGLEFDQSIAAHDGEAPAVVLYAWFEDPATTINAARLVLDLRGYAPGGELKLDLVGFDT